MNELINLIPEPDSLPVATGWFMIFSYLTYYLHLVSTGIMFGISVQTVLAHFRGKKDLNWSLLGNTLSKILPFTFAFTVNLGVAPLLFIQVLYGNFFYTASIILGIPWIFVFVLLIIAYFLAYWLVFKKHPDFKFKALFSVLITLIFTWIAFILVNINTLMMVPENWKIYYTGMNGKNLNLGETTLVPRFIFFVFLFISIGGLFTALFYKIKKKREESSVGYHLGSIICGYFCLFTAASFFLFLFSLPGEISRTFLRENFLWGLLVLIFFAGLLFIAYLSFKRKTLSAVILLVANLMVFVFIRNQIRFLYLKPFSEKFSILGKNTQYGVMVLFLVFFTLGLFCIFWLLKKVLNESLKQKSEV